MLYYQHLKKHKMEDIISVIDNSPSASLFSTSLNDYNLQLPLGSAFHPKSGYFVVYVLNFPLDELAKELYTWFVLYFLQSIKAVRVKKACSTCSPVLALVCIKQMPFSVHHLFTSFKSTSIERSFLLPKSIQLALGTLFWAIQYQVYLIPSQLFLLERSKTKTTPSQDLKQVATIDRYFSWPAVSQMQRRTVLSLTLISLQRKSTAVTATSRGYQFFMYLQKMEVLPAPHSPINMILYLSSSGQQFSVDILRHSNKYKTGSHVTFDQKINKCKIQGNSRNFGYVDSTKTKIDKCFYHYKRKVLLGHNEQSQIHLQLGRVGFKFLQSSLIKGDQKSSNVIFCLSFCIQQEIKSWKKIGYRMNIVSEKTNKQNTLSQIFYIDGGKQEYY